MNVDFSGHYLANGSNNILIEEGTIITDEDGTWEHKVIPINKRIRLTNKGGTYDLKVIKKVIHKDEPPKATVNHETHINDVHNTGDEINIVPSGYIFNSGQMDHYWIRNKALKLILTKDYRCKAFATTGLASFVHVSSRTNVLKGVSHAEEVAIETLREVISEKEFRRYIRDAFIIVKGKNGNTYQVFRDDNHIRVWQLGNIVEEICVVFKDKSIPLTDKVLAFKIMIETDESEFRKLGNVYNMRQVA